MRSRRASARGTRPRSTRRRRRAHTSTAPSGRSGAARAPSAAGSRCTASGRVRLANRSFSTCSRAARSPRVFSTSRPTSRGRSAAAAARRRVRGNALQRPRVVEPAFRTPRRSSAAALRAVHGQRRVRAASITTCTCGRVAVALLRRGSIGESSMPFRLRRQRRGELLGARLHLLGELRLRPDRVDEAPGDGLLAAHAFGHRAEHVGEVAADLALVDEAREAAGAGQHAEQRHFGQRHRELLSSTRWISSHASASS
jgi:hypothetical protein